MQSQQFAASIGAGTNVYHSNNAFGARRNARVVKLANIGPIWVSLLWLILKWSPSRQTAQRCIDKLETEGKIRCVGKARIGGGKRVQVYTSRKFWHRQTQHETDAMRFFFAYWPHAYALSGKDVDPKWRADLDFIVQEKTYRVEIDEDTEPLWQVRKRLAVYDDCPNTVLFVAPTLSRAREASRLTANPKVYFSVLETCLTDPWGGHWFNCLGANGVVAEPVAVPVAE